MPISHNNVNEVLFAGQHLHLLRSKNLRNRSKCLIKIPAYDTADASIVRQLTHEYDLCQGLDLAGVLRPLAKETVEGRPAIVFEDPGGVTLARLLATGPVALPLFLDMAIELADIIGRLHRKGIVHKDIHSGNVLVCTDCDPMRVYLTGLGIASLLPGQSVEKTIPDKLEGTLAVMSPEQTGRMNRPVDFRTDFYSLGAVFYHMLTGTLPFAGDDPLGLVHAHLAIKPQAPSKINPQIPSILSDLVLKLLAKDADDRFRSGAGIAADLKRCRDDWHRTGTISAFELARQDVSETFHIPDKLYGREEEIRTLQTAFERTCGGPVELLLVTGDAGIGKTELVNQLRQLVLQKEGYFIVGKCDPLDRKIPCAPFIEAISDTVDQLLARPQERIDRAREIIAQTLGDQGRVLTDVIPMLSLIIGEQPPVPELPPDQARNRFHLMIQRLFASATIMKRTVVVFLDDLQWADSSTLKMLETLACDTDLRNVFLIGAYREHEVDATHGLIHTLKEIEAGGGRIQTMALGPMPAKGIQALIADALDTSPSGISDLAALCQQKTGGNPFFLKRFLLELVARELIFFNTTRNVWQWHMDKIARADVTDNVVELMAGTIEGLDENVQQALKSAACIGGQFDLGILCAVMYLPPQTLLDHLWPGVQSGLISVLPGPGLHFALGLGGIAVPPVIADDAQTEQIRFGFVHVRIQEAVYGMMSDDAKMGLHLRIGRLLLEKCSQEHLDENIFDILGQLNRAAALITQPEEIVKLAKLNLKAGQRARSLALFESAFDYFRLGIGLMAEKGWQRHYELTKELHLKGVEAALLSGRHFELDHWYETAVHHIRSPVEVVDAYIAKMEKERKTTNFFHTIDVGRQILARLGVDLPAAPSQADVQAELEKTEKLLACFSDDDILGLPDMEDPYHLAALRVINISLQAAYWVDRKLYKSMVSKCIDLLLRHGSSELSATIFLTYANILTAIPEKIADAHHYGRLSIRLLDRYENCKYNTYVRWIFYAFTLPFSDNVRKSIEASKAIHREGMEIGDFVSAGYSLWVCELFRFFTGEPLEHMDRRMAQCLKVLKKIQLAESIVVLALHHQMVLNLMGGSEHRCALVGEAFDERIYLPQAEKERIQMLLVGIHFSKLMLAYLFERFEDAVGLAEKLENDVNYFPNLAPYLYRCYFYIDLARLAVCRTNAQQPDSALLEKVAAHQQLIQVYADAAPMNFVHLLHLIKAERARVEGRILDAEEHFDRSIELAQENGYPQEQALANELAAKFWMGRGKKSFAQLHMRQALDCYTRWGAVAKVQDLQEKHPEFFIKTEAEAATPEPMRRRRAEDLDVMSALRASRAISGEIRLDRLVEKLMAVVIENAGATSARLLLEADGHFYVAAEVDAGQPGHITRLDKAVALEKAEHLLPLQTVQYVQRTSKPVVIEDAAASERFGQDPYIVKNRPRSVLCSPIVRKENLIGLFYLENNLATNAFTDERLKMLDLLSAQIAVSLENAKLYESRRRAEAALEKHRDRLEELVKERTDELAVAKEQAEVANASKSDFLARMSHEIRTPLNAVTGLTQIALKTQLTDKQRDLLSKIQLAGGNLLDVINDILDFSKVEAGRLELTHAPFDLDQVMERLADLFSGRMAQKDLKLRIEAAPQVPRQLTGDAGRLTQILTNLIGNAVKFTDIGEIVVGVDLVAPVIGDQVIGNRVTSGSMDKEGHGAWDKKLPGQATLKFSVSDTGVGIAADVLPTLFDPFTQADGSLTRKHEGTGLGLAICRQLVQLMGGRIWAESTPGKGSTFSFTILLERRMDLPEAAAQHRAQAPDALPIQRLAGHRVLVVEDSELNRDVAVALLEETGLTVDIAENGRIGVDKVTGSEPGYYNAVLMDIQMPVMDGYEATRRIRAWEFKVQSSEFKVEKSAIQQPETRNKKTRTAIIALTAHALKGEKEKCLAADMDDYLPKPLDEQELQRVLLKWTTSEREEKIH